MDIHVDMYITKDNHDLAHTHKSVELLHKNSHKRRCILISFTISHIFCKCLIQTLVGGPIQNHERNMHEHCTASQPDIETLEAVNTM